MYSNAQGQKGTTKKGVPIMYDIEDKINFAVFPGRLYLAIVVNSRRLGGVGVPRMSRMQPMSQPVLHNTTKQQRALLGCLFRSFSCPRDGLSQPGLSLKMALAVFDRRVGFCLDWCRRL